MGWNSVRYFGDMIFSSMLPAIITFFVSEIYLVSCHIYIRMFGGKERRNEGFRISLWKRFFLVVLINSISFLFDFINIDKLQNVYLKYGISKLIIIIMTLFLFLGISLNRYIECWSRKEISINFSYFFTLSSFAYIYILNLIYSPISNFVHYYE